MLTNFLCRIFFKTFSLIVNQPPPQYFGRLQPDFSGKSFIVFKPFTNHKLVGVLGVEPRTSSLSGTRSNQLSYTPIVFHRSIAALMKTNCLFSSSPHGFESNIYLVEPKGLEPSTSCLQSRCSSQLSYGPGSYLRPFGTLTVFYNDCLISLSPIEL